jgi:hypothetical protein
MRRLHAVTTHNTHNTRSSLVAYMLGALAATQRVVNTHQ